MGFVFLCNPYIVKQLLTICSMKKASWPIPFIISFKINILKSIIYDILKSFYFNMFKKSLNLINFPSPLPRTPVKWTIFPYFVKNWFGRICRHSNNKQNQRHMKILREYVWIRYIKQTPSPLLVFIFVRLSDHNFILICALFLYVVCVVVKRSYITI